MKEKGLLHDEKLQTSKLFRVICRYQQSATLHLCRKEACLQYNAAAIVDLCRNTGRQTERAGVLQPGEEKALGRS